MNSARKRKLVLVLFTGSVLGLVTALVLYALSQNINLFYTPTQVVNGDASPRHTVRVGGMVVKGSIVRGMDDLSVEFKLTDFKQTVTVRYRGILPDLFREGQGIVALGKVKDRQHFAATQVLAKHDANYMPAEVREALAAAVQPGVKKSA